MKNQITQSSLFKDILTATGLDWEVRKEDLVAISTNLESEGQILEPPNAGIYRCDNDKYLGTASKKYVPYQNNELVQTIYEASKEVGLHISQGGELYGGKRVYIKLDLPEQIIGDAVIKRQITTMSSHTGLSSVGFGSSNQIYTHNTKNGTKKVQFFRLYNSLDKFRHCAAASGRIKNAVSSLFQSLKEDEQLMNSFKSMAKTKCTDELLEMIVKNCFEVDINANQSKLTTRQLNRLNQIAQTVNYNVKSNGNSVWGLFTGILEANQNNCSSSKSQEDFLMAGTGYNVNMKAFNTISAFLQKTNQ